MRNLLSVFMLLISFGRLAWADDRIITYERKVSEGGEELRVGIVTAGEGVSFKAIPGGYEAVRDDLDIRYGDGSPIESEVERFIRENVRPEIEVGDYAMAGKASDVPRTAAIAHYLKALVLIEQERLRRESR